MGEEKYGERRNDMLLCLQHAELHLLHPKLGTPFTFYSDPPLWWKKFVK
jgi:hypothetical protein